MHAVTEPAKRADGALVGRTRTSTGAALSVRPRRRYTGISIDLETRLYRPTGVRYAPADAARWAAAATLVAAHAAARGSRLLAYMPGGGLWYVDCLIGDDRLVLEALLGLEVGDYAPARRYLDQTDCPGRRCVVHTAHTPCWGLPEYLAARDQLAAAPAAAAPSRVDALSWRPLSATI